MASSRKRQLTLFACARRGDGRYVKKKADPSSSSFACDQVDTDSSSSAQHDGSSSESNSDSELMTDQPDIEVVDQPFAPSSKHDQENYVNVDKPSGSTIIIINSVQSPATLESLTATSTITQSQAVTTGIGTFPIDIAQ